MRSKALVSFVLASCLAVPAMATAVWTSGSQTISAIMWKPGYHGFYVHAGTFENPHSCSITSGLYLLDPAIEANAAETNRLLALLTTAMAQGKTLHIWIDGCHQGMPSFSGVQINN